jgi:hypothetical protein
MLLCASEPTLHVNAFCIGNVETFPNILLLSLICTKRRAQTAPPDSARHFSIKPRGSLTVHWMSPHPLRTGEWAGHSLQAVTTDAGCKRFHVKQTAAKDATNERYGRVNACLNISLAFKCLQYHLLSYVQSKSNNLLQILKLPLKIASTIYDNMN